MTHTEKTERLAVLPGGHPSRQAVRRLHMIAHKSEELIPLETVRERWDLQSRQDDFGRTCDPFLRFLRENSVSIFCNSEGVREAGDGTLFLCGFVANAAKMDSARDLAEFLYNPPDPDWIDGYYLLAEDVRRIETAHPFLTGRKLEYTDPDWQTSRKGAALPLAQPAQTDAELEALRAENASLREELARARAEQTCPAEQIATAEEAGELARVQTKLDALQAAIGLVPGEETPTAPLPLAVYMRLQGKSDLEIAQALREPRKNGDGLSYAQTGVLVHGRVVKKRDSYGTDCMELFRNARKATQAAEPEA